MINSLIKYFKAQGKIRRKDTAPIRVMGFQRQSDLYNLFNELGYKKGIEIGVRWGENAQKMCEAIPGLDLTVCDVWTNYDDADRLYQGDKHQRFYAKAKQVLAPYNVTFKKMLSMEAVQEFAPESLDFVYIDGNHKFDYIMEDLIEWIEKVRIGGMISGHDFSKLLDQHVFEAVNLYAKVHNIRELFMTDEQDPSFFWRKT